MADAGATRQITIGEPRVHEPGCCLIRADEGDGDSHANDERRNEHDAPEQSAPSCAFDGAARWTVQRKLTAFCLQTRETFQVE